MASAFKLELATPTSVRVVAGAGNAQVGVSVNGLFRYRASTVTAAHPGGAAGSHAVFVTASANAFAPPDTDTTDYNFGLEIRTSGSPSTFASRQIGTVDWDGTKIVAVHQQVGSYQPPLVGVATQVPANGLEDGQVVRLRVGSTPFEFLALTYDATYGKWVSPVVAEVVIGRGSISLGNQAAYTVIAEGAAYIRHFKALYDAGLRPQFALAGRGSTNLDLEDFRIAPRLSAFTDADDSGTETQLVAPADGNAIDFNSQTVRYKVRDWVTPAITAPSEEQAIVQLAHKESGSAVGTLLDVRCQVRLVSA